ncbi:hypothetical protein [Sinomonas albida]|uniref:hypothetical protein n=1 Tax=Sinomonas albida TaxID=369942 RepID=UPI00301A8576
MTTNPPSIPPDYIPARWVALYTKAELRWLCEHLSSENTKLRIVNRQIAARLEKETQP